MAHKRKLIAVSLSLTISVVSQSYLKSVAQIQESFPNLVMTNLKYVIFALSHLKYLLSYRIVTG